MQSDSAKLIKTETEIYETKFKLDIEKLENEKEELKQQIINLYVEKDDKDDQCRRLNAEIDELKHKSQSDIEKIRSDMVCTQEKYRMEYDNERDSHAKKIDSLNATIEELQIKLGNAERALLDFQNRGNILEGENNELKEKHEVLFSEMEQLRSELGAVRNDADKLKQEINRYKLDLQAAEKEIKSLTSTNDEMKVQLNTADDKTNSLNKTIRDQELKILDCELFKE
ncbi:unnamed protein product [Thelazia callipaeda]|uniref:Myosin_tail_1 domain-containing protein n=1 Tax=Thelazia callipaeda TaxID=103827 RepID=A0A0N5DBA6_THECL|nr:unnamed protein product [Thelazia callipaeda]